MAIKDFPTENLPEPNWREQLYVYGFSDEDIDALNAIPLHRYLIKMNYNFHVKVTHDVSEIIKDQWPNALTDSLKDYTKARDRKLLKYTLISGAVVIIISVSIGLAIFIWWHNKYYPNPMPIKYVVPALLSLFGL